MSGLIDDLDERGTVEVNGEHIANRRHASRDFDGPDQRRPRGRRESRRGLKWFLGLVGASAALATGTQTLLPLIPETRAHADEAHASLNAKWEDHDKRIQAVEQRLGSIDRNGLKTLNLQLRATLRSIESDLKALPPNAPGRANLEAQRDQAAYDLEENNRQLGYRP